MFALPSLLQGDSSINDSLISLLQLMLRNVYAVDSSELSRQGKTLADDEPYLICSGPFRELVISQPAHVQEFYRHDSKGWFSVPFLMHI